MHRLAGSCLRPGRVPCLGVEPVTPGSWAFAQTLSHASRAILPLVSMMYAGPACCSPCVGVTGGGDGPGLGR